MFETVAADVRYAARLLRKSPLFAATAVVSLAIGIGANTTIFSIASALLLRPLPGLERPDRLVDIGRTQEGQGFDTVGYQYYRDVRERTRTLTGVYAYRPEPRPMSLGGRGDAERIYGTIVTANYFEVLGTKAAAGRLLRDEDDRTTDNAVVVISYELWHRRFASDPALVGQTLTLNGFPFVVVGVAAPGFQGTTVLKTDAWVPVAALIQAEPRLRADLLTSRQAVWLIAGGRLADGVSVGQANAELAAIGAALEREYPVDDRGKGLRVAPWSVFPGQTNVIGGFLAVLMALVGLVLLIACVNLASMLLARAAARRREVAVRLAIGAGRFRLVRQLLTETILLFAGGGLAGLLLTSWLTKLLLALLPHLPFPISFGIVVDWRVTLFAAVASLFAALASGLVPALQASRADLVPALKTDGADAGPLKLRLRNAFVIGQIAMSLLLVIAAGLLLRSLQHAADIQPGFDDRHVDVVSLDLSVAGYDATTGQLFVRELLARARALPGIEVATAASDLPLDGSRMGMGGLKVPGHKPPEGEFFGADWNIVEPGFFRTLKLPLVRGRDFTDADTASAPPVAIVNEALARHFWPGEDPLGRQMFVQSVGGTEPRPLTVVGIAADAHLMSLGSPAEPYVYVPLAQRYVPRVAVLVRNADRSSIAAIRSLVRSLNANLPVVEAMPLTDATAIGLVPQRIAASVAGSLGLIGLLLAAIGIYGVTAYAVARRTREIGIRVALGAERSDIVRLVLRQAALPAAIGIGVGTVLAGAGSQLLRSLLFGVAPLDPVTFAAACALFAAVTLVASYVPARRALTVDGTTALRAE